MDDIAKLYLLEKMVSPTYISLIKTHDPEYLPASSFQVGEIKNLLVQMKETLESVVPGGTPPLLTGTGKQVMPTCLPAPETDSEIDEHLRYKFNHLATQWKDETQFASTMIEMAMHPAYQQIIGMGPSAILLILKQLVSEPDHWFWALKAITGEDPVPENSRGKLKDMAEAWLKWGQNQGYEY